MSPSNSSVVELRDVHMRFEDKEVLDGMSLHAVTERESVAHILDSLDHGHGGWVVTPNVDHARRFRANPEYRTACPSSR